MSIDELPLRTPGSPAASAASRWLVRLRGIDRMLLANAVLLAAIAAAAPSQLLPSAKFAAGNLVQLLPVLMLSVGIAAALSCSGADTLVARAFAGRQRWAIPIAALTGALSPLCSCGVVPLIAGLLAGGVPLAPVMAFWLASPIIDPAMFVLTAGVLGVEFAMAKTLAAIALGLAGGWVTVWLSGRGAFTTPLRDEPAFRGSGGAAGWASRRRPLLWGFWRERERRDQFYSTASAQARRLGGVMMAAFLLESLMLAYVPADLVAGWLGGNGTHAMPLAVAMAVPAYLNGAAAVPLVHGLIELGMNPALGLAFLVAGGVTSLPAAMAVWVLVRPRVFALYLALAAAGSLMVGYAYAAWLG
jgi:uncharacterized protein